VRRGTVLGIPLAQALAAFPVAMLFADAAEASA
jgi:hypothetical protein